jgi:hypothetical protein
MKPSVVRARDGTRPDSRHRVDLRDVRAGHRVYY